MRDQKPERRSLELDDYSGPFQPDLHLSDFSKEGLMKLVEVGGSIYGNVNRQWYRAAIKRFGQEVADEMHHEVWFADGGSGDHENYTISKLMGFEDADDETAAMKVWQCLPAMSTRMTLEFESRGDHEWEMHTPQCDVPETGEREGPEVMAYMCDKICGHLELFGFRHGAARWNANIRIDPENFRRVRATKNITADGALNSPTSAPTTKPNRAHMSRNTGCSATPTPRL
jgi:hypothetical protein